MNTRAVRQQIKQLEGLALSGALIWCCLMPSSAGAEGVNIRPKLSMSTAIPAAPAQISRQAPFVLGAVEEIPALTFNPELERVNIPGSCANAGQSLCYDYRNRRAVYRPARKLMPEIAGLKRESLTLKRDKITFNYSF